MGLGPNINFKNLSVIYEFLQKASVFRLYQGQTLEHITKNSKLQKKSFITMVASRFVSEVSIKTCQLISPCFKLQATICLRCKFFHNFFCGQYYKTFQSHNLRIFVISQSFVLGKPFQPSLMFVGEARSLPQGGAPERCFTRVRSGLTCKRYTRLERQNKHPSLLRKSINYGRKKFYNTGPWCI